MTGLEYIKQAGDNLVEFVPTKQDLVDLANMLACILSRYDYDMRICFDKSELFMRDYTEYRLLRILDYLPELESEIREKLRSDGHRERN